MKDSDLGYLCSMVDSEGNISIGRHYRNGKYRYTFSFRITNTNIVILNHIKQITKCGIVLPTKRKNPNYRDIINWVANHNESAKILPIVEPYLVIKRQQAILGIEYFENCRHEHTRHKLTLEQEVLKEIIFEEMQILNKRGDSK